MSHKEQLKLISLQSLIRDLHIAEIINNLKIDNDSLIYLNSEQIHIINESLKKDFKTIPNSKKILKSAESKLNDFLSTFKCSKNEDVESFLKEKSIKFNKQNKARKRELIKEKN